MAPVTSVMMPAYNAAGTIGEALASALAQTVADIEVIVVDDGSEDETAAVASATGDRRVRLVRLGRNRGVSTARNHALWTARAPLVSVLDADDAWDADYLESVLPALADPAIALVYANCRNRRNPGAPEYLPQANGSAVGIADPWNHPMDTFPAVCEHCPAPALTVTMRAAAARAAGGYATWLRCGSDWHLYLKLIAAGWRFAYVDRVLATYRWPEPGRGMSFDLARREWNDLKLWAAFAARHPLTPGVWRRVAHDLRRVTARRAPVLGRIRRAVQAAG